MKNRTQRKSLVAKVAQMSKGQIWAASLLSEAREVATETVSNTSFHRDGEDSNGIVNLVDEFVGCDTDTEAQEILNLMDDEVKRMTRALNKVRSNVRKAANYLNGVDVASSCKRCGVRQ